MLCSRRTFLGATTLTAAGCATTSGALFASVKPPAAGKAVVYVYRPYAFAGSFLSQSVTVNGLSEAPLSLDGYVRFEVQPGWTVVANVPGDTLRSFTRSFALQAGDIAFVRFTVSPQWFDGGMKGNMIDSPYMGFAVVAKEVALVQLREMRQSDPRFQ